MILVEVETMIEKKKLIKVSKLLKEKGRLLGKTTKDVNEKHNIRIQRLFIDKITKGDIDKYVGNLEKELRREKNGEL